MTDPSGKADLTGLTSEIVAAYVTNNSIVPSDLPQLIDNVSDALRKADAQAIEPPKEDLKPAIAIRNSVKPDHIVCLEDGKKFKSLKRHLRTDHGLTPEEYRERWSLKHDYPMVAPDYAAARSKLAKKMGLGRKAKK